MKAVDAYLAQKTIKSARFLQEQGDSLWLALYELKELPVGTNTSSEIEKRGRTPRGPAFLWHARNPNYQRAQDALETALEIMSLRHYFLLSVEINMRNAHSHLLRLPSPLFFLPIFSLPLSSEYWPYTKFKSKDGMPSNLSFCFPGSESSCRNEFLRTVVQYRLNSHKGGKQSSKAGRQTRPKW